MHGFTVPVVFPVSMIPNIGKILLQKIHINSGGVIEILQRPAQLLHIIVDYHASSPLFIIAKLCFSSIRIIYPENNDKNKEQIGFHAKTVCAKIIVGKHKQNFSAGGM